MYNLSPRRLLTRAGTGVAALALVGLAGYGVGQTPVAARHGRRGSSPSTSAAGAATDAAAARTPTS